MKNIEVKSESEKQISNEADATTALERVNKDEDFLNGPLRMPAVDIFENSGSYFLIAEMPGVKKENARVKIESGSFQIMGRIESKPEESKGVLREIGYGNYYRKFRISDSIDEAGITATLESGRLTLALPKTEMQNPELSRFNSASFHN